MSKWYRLFTSQSSYLGEKFSRISIAVQSNRAATTSIGSGNGLQFIQFAANQPDMDGQTLLEKTSMFMDMIAIRSFLSFGPFTTSIPVTVHAKTTGVEYEGGFQTCSRPGTRRVVAGEVLGSVRQACRLTQFS